MHVLLRWIAVSMTTMSIVGCAVMTVDVDVYKGPLSNNTEVQLEQVASLAIGAKPLLIQLRDILEFPEQEKHRRIKWQHGLKSPVGEGDTIFERAKYRPGYIPPEDGRRVAGLSNEYARQVNNVLSLYEQRSDLPEPFNRMWADINEAVRNYAMAYKLINPTRVQAAEEWASEFMHKHWAPGKACRKHKDLDKQLRCQLGQAYAEFWLPEGLYNIRPSKNKIVSITNKILVLIQDKNKAIMKATRSHQHRMPVKFHDFKINRNATTTEPKTDAFFEWLAKDETRRLHANLLFPRDQNKARLFERRVGEIANGYLDARAAIEHVLVRSAELWRAVEEDDGAVLSHRKRTDLSRASRKLLKQTHESDSWNDFLNLLDNEQNVEARAKLFTKLLSDHRNAKSTDNRHGLARGPTKELSKDLTTIVGVLQYAGGLEQGRPAEGLEELVNAYVDARMDVEYDFANQAPLSVRALRDRLLIALVHFAEKVRTLGNLSVLLRNDNEIRQYQLVLQAVANSILFQIDSLATYQEHMATLRPDRIEAEKRVAEQIWGKGVRGANEPLKLRDDFAENAKNPMEVIDEVIALLEHEHARVLVMGGNNGNGSANTNARAKRLRQAVISLRERRGNQMRLIPASVYLRTSYPATRLQSDPSSTDANLLAGSRRIPRDDLEIIRNIDKQYWQSVNQVRVSGGGKTNYVVTKDDLGNWYVKSYSSKVDDIIKSAKNLALFALAQPLAAGGFDAIPAIGNQNSNASTGQSSTGLGGGVPTRFERQIAAFDSAENERAAEDYKRIYVLHSSALELLGKSYIQARKALNLQKRPNEAQGDPDAFLHDLSSVYHHLRTHLETEEDRDEKLPRLNASLGVPLTALIKDREAALARLETVLDILAPAPTK